MFQFEPHVFLPYRDKEVLERVRNIRREDMEKHWNPDFKIKIVPEVTSLMVADAFTRIKMSDDLDQRVVLVFPNPWAEAYANPATLINQFRVNCRNVWAFCADEFADQDGNVAPVTYKGGLGYAFMNTLYAKIDPKLRMPENQCIYFTTENYAHYSDLIDEAGNGGADVIYNGCGWAGHTSFVDPSVEFETDTISLDEFKKIGSRLLTLHPLSICECSFMGTLGASGDVFNVPPKAVTIGPRDMQHARLRFDFHCFTFPGGYFSWQRMISRLGIWGPVTPLVPYSLNQELRCNVYITEDMARPIESALTGF